MKEVFILTYSTAEVHAVIVGSYSSLGKAEEVCRNLPESLELTGDVFDEFVTTQIFSSPIDVDIHDEIEGFDA